MAEGKAGRAAAVSVDADHLPQALGAVYLAAFWSLGVQVDGLFASTGILPAGQFLAQVERVLGSQGYWRFPTLLWLNSSDGFLRLLCWGGVALSGLLVAGVLPGVCLVLLWIGYLSLAVAGQDFFHFQWDSLLLETGLLAILLSPWGLWLGKTSREPSRWVVWLIRWLLFRVVFQSGVVKLASGDPTWKTFTALSYHYETQPLPTWTSWYMHQLPAWFHMMSVGLMFGAELIAPFLVFAPRRLRMIGFWSIVLFQVLIAATGNYGFFNLLTVVLCLALVEDRDWGRREAGEDEPRSGNPRREALLGVAAGAIVLMTVFEGVAAVSRPAMLPEPWGTVRGWVEPLRSLNSYGLFAVMTTERPEIIVEGSRDGVTWRPYPFRWKPGERDRRPRFSTPHMPRLDWQMWFAALSPDCRYQPWFIRFEQRLLEGSPAVLRLLRANPFPERPPRYVRARLYLYRFTGRGAKAWWRSVDAGLFCPSIERGWLRAE